MTKFVERAHPIVDRPPRGVAPLTPRAGCKASANADFSPVAGFSVAGVTFGSSEGLSNGHSPVRRQQRRLRDSSERRCPR